jgi:hypothetical protein
MTKTKNDDYERGYSEGYLAGFHAARDNDSLMSPNIPMRERKSIYANSKDEDNNEDNGVVQIRNE